VLLIRVGSEIDGRRRIPHCAALHAGYDALPRDLILMGVMNLTASEPAWPDQLFAVLKAADVRQVGYVPDAGHARLIELCAADPAIRHVVLTTEEEGIALAAEPPSAGSARRC
jgi:hypothetical protein